MFPARRVNVFGTSKLNEGGTVAFRYGDAGRSALCTRTRKPTYPEAWLSCADPLGGSRCGTPCGLFGSNGWTTDHSKSVRSKRAIRASMFRCLNQSFSRFENPVMGS